MLRVKNIILICRILDIIYIIFNIFFQIKFNQVDHYFMFNFYNKIYKTVNFKLITIYIIIKIPKLY
jgi:hypothetical protein